MISLAIIAAALAQTPQLNAARADLNGDGIVDSVDQGILLGMWGKVTGDNAAADLNQSGAVNGADLGLLGGAWGALVPVTKPFTVTDAAHGGSLEVPVGATPIRQPGEWTDSAGAVITRHELIYEWTTPSGACRVYRRTQ